MRIELIALVFLAGCATDPMTAKYIADANERIASTPTLTLTCTQGCAATYTDPRDKPPIAMPTNGWDAARDIAKTGVQLVNGVAPWVAVGSIASNGLKRAGGNDSSVANTTTTDTVTTETQTVTTTETQTQTTTDNSNQGNATATPTVVTQPAPTVVHQPTPIVVTP
jgi:hypothetical protein